MKALLDSCPCGSGRAFVSCHGVVSKAALDNCPCGSGKIFLACHGLTNVVPLVEGQVSMVDAAKSLAGVGFERVQALAGSTFRDCSTIIIIPERTPVFHWQVVQSWLGLVSPMNQKRCIFFCINDEVGVAYTSMVQHILRDPVLSTFKYVLTLETDNIIPPDAHIRLLESIEAGRFDAVGGIYFTKGDFNMPMCYGDAAEYHRTGVLNFQPLNIGQALQNGNIVECNGVAMGCTLYRMDLFRQIPSPWFVSVSDVIPNVGAHGFTQDLFFCKRAKEAGKRFAIDLRVRVGHIDVKTGVVY